MKPSTFPDSGGLGIVLCLLLLLAPARARSQNPTTRIDSLARAALEDGPIAGLSIAVMRGSGTLHAQGYGWADIEDGVPATPETIYPIASVTKLFTAVAVMTLVEAGRLRLDDDLATLLPDFPDPEQGQQITLRHLLSHTSGLNDIAAADLERWMQEGTPLTPAFVRDHLGGRPLDFVPGTRWSYSNSGFYLAGLIIERVSGEPYGTYVREAVAVPLGLHDTFLCDDNLLPARSTGGYAPSDSGLVRTRLYEAAGVETGVRADGGICATVLDLARLPEALKERGQLSEASLAAMTRPTTLASGTRVDYGLGVRRGILDGHALWGHTGGVTSYWSVLAHYPDDKVTIAVLVNTDGGAEDALTIEGGVARVVLGLGPPTLTDHPLTPEARRIYLGAYVGYDEAEGTVRYRVVHDGERVGLVQPNAPSARRTLLYQGAHTFGREDWPMDRFLFHVVGDEAWGYSTYYNGIFADFYVRDDP